MGTEVFQAPATEITPAAGGKNPGHADPVPHLVKVGSRAAVFNPGHHLVSRNDRIFRGRSSPLDLVKLGMTDSAGQDPQQHFTRPGNGNFPLAKDKRLGSGAQIDSFA